MERIMKSGRRWNCNDSDVMEKTMNRGWLQFWKS